jgi:hypothetical protein
MPNRVSICDLKRGDAFYDPDCQPHYVHRFCQAVMFKSGNGIIDYIETHTIGYMKDEEFYLNLSAIKDQYNPSAMVVRVKLSIVEV